MAELTTTGLEIDTLAEILEQIETDEKAEIDPALDLSTSSLLGQLNRLFARAIRIEQEALQTLYAMLDPDSATGDALRRLCAITGTYQEAATASRVEVVCDLDAGVYAVGALSAAPTGRPEDLFRNLEEITSVGGNTDVIFEALETGAIQVAADTLEIAAPVVGWNSIESHPAATPGSPIETEAALRVRRAQEVAAPGSSSEDGIVADLTSNIDGIISAYVVANETDATVDSIPAHSIEVVVYGPVVPTGDDDQAVAEQIFASKAAGIGTYGTTTRTVVDSTGRSHTIRFTRPTVVDVGVDITLVTDSTFQGVTDFETYIAERAAATFVPGLDCSWSHVARWAMEVQGVLRITALSIEGVSFGTQTITSRQIAAITTDIDTIAAIGTP